VARPSLCRVLHLPNTLVYFCFEFVFALRTYSYPEKEFSRTRIYRWGHSDGGEGVPHIPLIFGRNIPYPVNFLLDILLLDIFLLDIPFYLIWISYISLIPRYPVSYTYFTQISHIPKTPWKGLTGLSFPFKYSFYYFRRERKLRIVTLSDGVVGEGGRQT